MSGWEDDALNKEVQAFIEFDEEGMGKFQFGHVQGVMNHYRTKKRDRMRVAQFNWHGEDGAAGLSPCGRRWLCCTRICNCESVFYLNEFYSHNERHGLRAIKQIEWRTCYGDR